MCVCVCGYKHVSAQAFYEHAIALLTPEILTLQPDRAATGKRVLVVVVVGGGFSSSVVFATRHGQPGWPQWQACAAGWAGPPGGQLSRWPTVLGAQGGKPANWVCKPSVKIGSRVPHPTCCMAWGI